VTVYVLHKGRLVVKTQADAGALQRSMFPAPMVSRFDTFASPVTGQSISSWRQRERDMNAADAIDRRDIPQKTFEKRKQIVERNARADQSS
jgi:hypothetical protein